MKKIILTFGIIICGLYLTAQTTEFSNSYEKAIEKVFINLILEYENQLPIKDTYIVLDTINCINFKENEYMVGYLRHKENPTFEGFIKWIKNNKQNIEEEKIYLENKNTSVPITR